MAKDDYHVVAYKILIYLYACMKGKIIFDKAAYRKAIGADDVNAEYLVRIYRMMSMDGLIEGAGFTRAWGDVYILSSDESEFAITSSGISYLQENDRMKKIGRFLAEKVDPIAGLAKLIGIHV